ncbi:MAG: squalene synthase HpnC [Phycisphaerales bacterium]|jgi:squalene synthase HpnC|nr:squalene synthase HpnC [Phycisphaerales bacterium]
MDEAFRRYQARRHTRKIALSHYENFTVVSLALPRHLQQDFYNIYAFCRHADDLADEICDKNESLRLLDQLRQEVGRMYQQQATQPILVALTDTVQKFDIPADPFLALIDAFEQDQRVCRYDTYEQLVDYCRRSADPVGHLVLYLCGYRDAHRQKLSDFTCTALQLTNFWQDVVPDLGRGRIYLPLEDLARFGVREEEIIERRLSENFLQLMKYEVDRAEELFVKGEALLPLVEGRLRTDVTLYGRGGRAILDRIRGVGYDVLSQRPTLNKWAKLGLFARALWQVVV